MCHESGLSRSQPYVVIHAGANWDLKQWPKERFVPIVRYLDSQGINAVLVGTLKEKDLIESILSEARVANAISLCGKTSILELAALMERACLVLSGDSGPIHIAAGVGVPLIALFGPTSPACTKPISRGPVGILHHRIGCVVPCYFKECHKRVCMERIGSREVIDVLQEMLGEVHV